MKKLFYIWLAQQMRDKEGKALRLIEEAGGIENLYAAAHKGTVLDSFGQLYNLDASTVKAEEILDDCVKMGIGIVTPEDELYPKRLRDLKDPPLVLYYKGRWKSFDDTLTVAMVGQRKASAVGKMVSEKTAGFLAQNGVYIVSGLAAGIDGASHRGALKANGYTVGVLGTGLDKCYPAENAGLMRTMTKDGLVISEYPPKTAGFPSNFPKRNRIVAALSRCTIVVEAREKSGSLITARLAHELGREVFAVITDSEGCKSLVSQSIAQAVRGPEDILNYYSVKPPLKEEKKEIRALSNEEDDILKLIALGNGKEEIALKTGLDIAVVTRRINMLEIKGYIIKKDHSKYEIAERTVR